MEKDVLYEPMKEAKKKYQEFFESEKNIPDKELQRFKSQQRCVEEIIAMLDSVTHSKQILMKKFEELQTYGFPP